MHDPLSRLAYTAAALSRKSDGQQHHKQQQQQQRHQQHAHHTPQHHHQPAGAGSAETPSEGEDALMADAEGVYTDDEPSTENDDGLGGLGIAGLRHGTYDSYHRQTPLGRIGSGAARELLPASPAAGGANRQGGDCGTGMHADRGRAREGDRASSPPCGDGGEDGSQGGAGGVSGGGAKRPGSRRPVQFWGIFNDWWRAELERTSKRPTADAVGRWYAAHAVSCWGPHAPSLEETRTHAKCLRSVGSIREYFRGYRARKKARQGEDPSPAGAGHAGLNGQLSTGNGGGHGAAHGASVCGASSLPNLAALSTLLPQLSQLGGLGLSPLQLMSAPKYGTPTHAAAAAAAAASIMAFPDMPALAVAAAAASAAGGGHAAEGLLSPGRALGAAFGCASSPYGMLSSDAAAAAAAAANGLYPLLPSPLRNDGAAAVGASAALPRRDNDPQGLFWLERTEVGEKAAAAAAATITTGSGPLARNTPPEAAAQRPVRPAAITTAASLGGSGACGGEAASGGHGGKSSSEGGGVTGPSGTGSQAGATRAGAAATANVTASPSHVGPPTTADAQAAAKATVGAGRRGVQTVTAQERASGGQGAPKEESAFSFRLTPGCGSGVSDGGGVGLSSGVTPPPVLLHFGLPGTPHPSRHVQPQHLLEALPFSDGAAVIRITPRAAPAAAAARRSGASTEVVTAGAVQIPVPGVAAPATPTSHRKPPRGQAEEFQICFTLASDCADGDGGKPFKLAAAGSGGGAISTPKAGGGTSNDVPGRSPAPQAEQAPPSPFAFRPVGSREPSCGGQHASDEEEELQQQQQRGAAGGDAAACLVAASLLALGPVRPGPAGTSGSRGGGGPEEQQHEAKQEQRPRGPVSDLDCANPDLVSVPSFSLMPSSPLALAAGPPPAASAPANGSEAAAPQRSAAPAQPGAAGDAPPDRGAAASPGLGFTFGQQQQQQQQQQHAPGPSRQQQQPRHAQAPSPSPHGLYLTHHHHSHHNHQHPHALQHQSPYHHMTAPNGGGGGGCGGDASASHSHAQVHSNSQVGHSDVQQSAAAAAAVAAAAGGTTASASAVPSLRSLLARPDPELCGLLHELRHDQLVLLLMRAVAMVRQKRAHEERLMDELAQVLEQQGNLQAQLHTQRVETARMYRTIMDMRDARSSGGGAVADGGAGGATLASAAPIGGGAGTAGGAGGGAGFTSSAVSPPRRRFSMEDEAGLSPAAFEGAMTLRSRPPAGMGAGGGLSAEPSGPGAALARPAGGGAATVGAAALSGCLGFPGSRDGARAAWGHPHHLHSPACASATDAPGVAAAAAMASAARSKTPGRALGGGDGGGFPTRGSAAKDVRPPNVGTGLGAVASRSADHPAARSHHDGVANGAFASGGGSVDGATAAAANKAVVCSDGGSGTSSAF